MATETTHEDLFEQYVERLAWSVAEADKFAAAELASLEQQVDGDVARAHEIMEETGQIPASSPYVLGAIREFWLACARLNESRRERFVEPADLVYTWLKQVRPDLAEFIGRLPYWPVGQDEEGRWI